VGIHDPRYRIRRLGSDSFCHSNSDARSEGVIVAVEDGCIPYRVTGDALDIIARANGNWHQ
jgi:hypothetical protein